MSEAAGTPGSPYLDNPGQRLVWIVPTAVLLWAAILLAFSWIMQRSAPPPPELKPLEARIVELPPPQPAGLQATPSRPIAPVAPKPKPEVMRRASLPRHERMKPIVPPLLPPSEAGTGKGEAPPPSSASTTPATSGPAGIGTGLGRDTAGARAIYAPKPTIPDDLREDLFNAVAVAHFRVDYDGKVEVVLSQPTSNPRLNQVVLDALRQWRFFPATRNGVAVPSEFDVRIPISVQ